MKKLLFVTLCTLIVIVGCNSKEKLESDQTPTDNANVAKVSISFREVDVKVEDKIAYLKGEVNTTENQFFYTVEQGESRISDETSIELDAKRKEWEEFNMEIPLSEENLKSEEVPIIKLYVKANDNIINPNYIPIEIKKSS